MVPIPADRFVPRALPAPLATRDIHVWFFPAWTTTRDSAGSAFVRHWLAAYGGCDVDSIVIERDARGKPFLADGRLHFNLSHSGGALMLAIGDSANLGVDLEVSARPRRATELAQRWFDPAETAGLMRLSEDARAAAFVRLWSCKEALLKADGGGIADGLHRAVFRLGNDGAVAGFGDTNGFPSYAVVPLEPAVGYVGALAAPAGHSSIKTFRYSGRVGTFHRHQPIDTDIQSG